ncbi:phospholipase A2 inhibitor NAI-like [Discoglossus pictus]
MKLLIFCLCSLSGFRTTAYGTFCQSCYQLGSDKCKEKTIYCPEDSKCITISEIMNLEGFILQTFYKGCAGNLSCDTLSYGSAESSSFAQSYNCCSGNYCNTGTFSKPPTDSDKFNGIQCPSCFQLGLKECISTKTKMCRGSQNKCAQFIGRYRTKASRRSGCSGKPEAEAEAPLEQEVETQDQKEIAQGEEERRGPQGPDLEKKDVIWLVGSPSGPLATPPGFAPTIPLLQRLSILPGPSNWRDDASSQSPLPTPHSSALN